MRWQLTGIKGSLGTLPAAQALGTTVADSPLVPDEHGQCRMAPALALTGHELLYARLEPLLESDRANWVILPHSQRLQRPWWEAKLGNVAEIGFGRAAVTLALSQLSRLAVPGRLIAADVPAEDGPGIEGVLALEWTPAEQGLAFALTQMDGRLDGKTDVGAILDQGREIVSKPEVLMCPGTGSDGHLERLLPFLGHLGAWAEEDVRWEFPEAHLGQLGVVGSLFSWAWLEAGYRLGDWAGPGAVLELDESPLVGLSLVHWTCSDDTTAGALA